MGRRENGNQGMEERKVETWKWWEYESKRSLGGRKKSKREEKNLKGLVKVVRVWRKSKRRESRRIKSEKKKNNGVET